MSIAFSIDRSDETTFGAFKIMKRLQHMEYGEVPETGRKVECIFVTEGVEISNIEFKRLSISGTEVAIQNRRNVPSPDAFRKVFAHSV